MVLKYCKQAIDKQKPPLQTKKEQKMPKYIFYITLFLTSPHLYSSTVEEYKKIAIGKAFAELKKEAALLQEKKLAIYNRTTANIEELRQHTVYLVDLINKDIVEYSKEDVEDFLKKITLLSSG